MEASTPIYSGAPIRQSIFLFVVKVFFALFLIDTLYAVLGFAVWKLGAGQYYHNNLFILFLVVHVLKNFLQITIVLRVVFSWVGSVWYIHNRQLVKREGILHVQEKVYDLTIIRAIDIDQGIVGKLFRYGSINLTTSASGGYNEYIVLTDISEPEQCAEIVKKYLSSSQLTKQQNILYTV